MTILTWIPLAISGISLMVSFGFGIWAAIDRSNSFRVSREREIYSWAEKTLALVPDLQRTDHRSAETAKSALSVQIDIGRLLFPNDKDNHFGKEKHPLNHGYRSKVLDPLVDIYNLHFPLDEKTLKRFHALRKDFIFEVGQHFQPVKLNTSPEYLTNWHMNQEKTAQ